ncbi:MAG: class I SAM-dependent methyltransferase [Nitriliruptorales bacterium]|nr:class I SAM-dependent methyltransferase [Nitriliruptorales bacterium]
MSDSPQASPPLPETWYHSLDLPTGRTPGEFNLDVAVEDVPWPDLTGLRCLDVATYDGYWAFEMERRGAAEVVALDIADKSEIDYVPRRRSSVMTGPTGAGFAVASRAFGSRVRRVEGSAYTMSPDELGTFDVVFMGSLLAHLRAPMTVLERAREVCHGLFISMEPVDLRTSVLWRGTPVMAFVLGFDWVWTTPNVAGHRSMLRMAGFDVEQQVVSALAFEDRTRLSPLGRLRRRVGMWSTGAPPVVGLPASIVSARPAEGIAAAPISSRTHG